MRRAYHKKVKKSHIKSSYDQFGRLTSITQNDGNQIRQTSFTYDQLSRIDSLTDALGQTSNFQYDDLNRLTVQTLPSSEQINMSYDGNSNMTLITPPQTQSHNFSYSPVNLMTLYDPPLANNETTYDYNLDRQLEAIHLPTGELIDYQYHVDTGQLMMIDGPGSDDYSYTYNQKGQVQQIAFNGQNLAFTYDGFLPLSQTWSGTINGSVSATYNNNFWITQLSIAGTPFNFGYDNDGLLTSAGAQTLVRSASTGLLTSTSLNTASETFSYSNFGELSSQSATVNNNNLYNANFVRDELGRITQKTETVEGVQKVYDYTYDSENRLDTVTIDNVLVRDYAYDANSNQIAPAVAVYDAQDRVLEFNGVIYAYNANGALLSKTAATDVTTYNYDPFGNLRSVTLPDNTLIEYVIDGRNRRIGKKVNGNLVQGFLYQTKLNPIAELDGQGTVISRFIYANKGTPAYMVKQGVTYKIISDYLGSVRLVVNAADGAVAQRMDYDEYGAVVSDTNPGFQPFGFAGGLWSAETQLIRFGKRDLDPQLGRFTTRDPLYFEGGLTNLYSYVGQDPINITDPTGTIVPAIPIIIGVAELLTDAAIILGTTAAAATLGDAIGQWILSKDIDMTDPSTWPAIPGGGQCTEGAPTRKKARERGEKSLYDEEGGEWRPHVADDHHDQSHWDYKPPVNNGEWEDIPFE